MTMVSLQVSKAYMDRFGLSKSQVEEQKTAFDALDLDGNGKITFQEVKEKLEWEMNTTLGSPMSDKELNEQFVSLDVDRWGAQNNNIVTFAEFLKVFVKGEFGRDVLLPNVDETAQVNDLIAPERPRLSSRLDPIDESKMVMKLSQEKSVSYYLRIAKQMLTGAQDKAAYDLLELNALGYAIPLATGVAAALEEEKLAQVQSIRTDLREVPQPR